MSRKRAGGTAGNHDAGGAHWQLPSSLSLRVKTVVTATWRARWAPLAGQQSNLRLPGPVRPEGAPRVVFLVAPATRKSNCARLPPGGAALRVPCAQVSLAPPA